MDFVMKYLNSDNIQIIDARSSSRLKALKKSLERGLEVAIFQIQ